MAVNINILCDEVNYIGDSISNPEYIEYLKKLQPDQVVPKGRDCESAHEFMRLLEDDLTEMLK